MVDIVPVSEIYDGLTIQEISTVQHATDEIRISSRIAVRSMVAIGKRLAVIKVILTANGRWRQWLKESFDASHDTADRYIQVAEKFGDLSQIASFDKAALYLLAGNDIPQEARDKALQLAEQGERITRQVAQEIAQTFQKAAVKVVEEALASAGHVSLNGDSVALIDAAVAQEAAELVKLDKDTVIRHIEQRDRHLKRKVFLKLGGLDEFQKIMRTGEPKKFKGKLYISMWGIPEEDKHE